MDELYLVCRFPNVDAVGRFTRSDLTAQVAAGRVSGSFVCRPDANPGSPWLYVSDFLRLPPAAPPPLSLLPCRACGWQISSHADACPRCGHPNAPSARPASGPKCYACDAASTTRCQRCDTFSCPLHLSSTMVLGGGNQLRCDQCRASAARGCWAYFLILAAIILAQIIYFGFLRATGP